METKQPLSALLEEGGKQEGKKAGAPRSGGRRSGDGGRREAGGDQAAPGAPMLSDSAWVVLQVLLYVIAPCAGLIMYMYSRAKCVALFFTRS